MKKVFRILFKISISYLIPSERSINQISWDHKHFIFNLKNEDKINLSTYIFNHLCEAIKDGTKLHKRNVSYARLLSEFFFQVHLIGAFKNLSNNGDLEEIYGNVLSASILANMQLMKKTAIVTSKIPLSVRCTDSYYLEDYPIITKMDNPEVIKN